MNYIKRLQDDVLAHTAEAVAMRDAIADFRAFLLTSPKFGNRQVYDLDGLPVPEPTERLDWIAVGDVVRRLECIVTAGRDAREGVA